MDMQGITVCIEGFSSFKIFVTENILITLMNKISSVLKTPHQKLTLKPDMRKCATQ